VNASSFRVIWNSRSSRSPGKCRPGS